jgi:hypothetical protein
MVCAIKTGYPIRAGILLDSAAGIEKIDADVGWYIIQPNG